MQEIRRHANPAVSTFRISFTYAVDGVKVVLLCRAQSIASNS